MALLKTAFVSVWLALSLADSQAAGDHAARGHVGHDHGGQDHAGALTQKWQRILAQPSLAVTATFAPDGRLWITSIRDNHLFVSHSDDKGETFSDPVRVTRGPEHIAGDGENRPKIVAMRDGRILVSYTQSLEQPMTGHVRFSQSRDGGKTFSPPVTVNDDRQVISHRFEALGVNERGEIYLAWLDKRDLMSAREHGDPYNGAAVYRAKSRDGGKTFTNDKIADHSCECCRIAMAIDADGVPVIAWRHIFQGSVRDHALARLDDSLLVRRASHDEWRVEACPHHGPALAIDARGVYHLAWFSNAPARGGLFYAHSSDKGGTFTTPYAFGDPARAPAHPSVITRGSDVFLAWKEFDGESMNIRVLRSTDGGRSWSAPATIAASVGASDHPFLIADREAVYLSWSTAKEGYRLLPLKGVFAP